MMLPSYEYERMRLVEDSYWWYRALQKVLVGSLKEVLAKNPQAKILDAGCGTGGNLQALRKAYPSARFYGVDISPDALEMTKSRGFDQIQLAPVENLPFDDETFDVLISMDVLYIDGLDEKKAASEFFRVLKKDGIFVFNLPAFNILRGAHDQAIRTARRYTKASVRTLLASAKFRATRLFYWNVMLFPFLVFWRPLSQLFSNKKSPKSDLKLLPPLFNQFMTWWVLLDIKMSKNICFPFGSSVFGLAKKLEALS